MQFKSVCLALSFGELTPTPVEESRAAESYAIAFCAHERAHLSVFMAAPNLRIPSAGFISLAHAIVDEINAKRRIHAGEAEKRYERRNGCRHNRRVPNRPTILFGHELLPCHGSENERRCDRFSVDGWLILGQGFDRSDAVHVRRPVLVIPPHWERGPDFHNIMIGWDGGARAARAVGDAMPLLTRAEQVEIVCVSPDASKAPPVPLWRLTSRDIVRT